MTKLRRPAAGLAALLMTMGGIADAAATKSAEPEGIMPPPPDYEEVMRKEFAEIEKRGTVEAYELFIARHPDHPLAEEARRKIENLRQEKQQDDK